MWLTETKRQLRRLRQLNNKFGNTIASITGATLLVAAMWTMPAAMFGLATARETDSMPTNTNVLSPVDAAVIAMFVEEPDPYDWYQYRAIVTDVYDGDTVTVIVRLGLGIRLVDQKIRLYGINTPEVRGPERPRGLVSAKRLRDLVFEQGVILKTEKDKTGKFGRLLGTLYVNGTNVNLLLIREGLAAPYFP